MGVTCGCLKPLQKSKQVKQTFAFRGYSVLSAKIFNHKNAN